MTKGIKQPLYRKVNTTAHGVRHRVGGDYRTRRGDLNDSRQGMSQGMRRGLDYTPLFRFLLSRVGDDWDAIHSEAVARLDSTEPISWLVALSKDDGKDVVRVGESSYYSGLYVDDANRLQIVDPAIGPQSLEPQCKCCTHTFNGVPFTRHYREA